MFDDQATSGGTTSTQFMEGTPVFDLAGEKVGTVSEHGVQDNCLVIHHGLLNRDVYIPLGVIQSNDANGVILSISKDEALNEDWQAASTQSGMTATAAGPATLDTGRTDATMGPAVTDATTGPAVTDATTGPSVVGPTATGTTSDVAAGQDAVAVPVREEELVVGKREQEIGRVHLHKDVVEEQQTVSEPVMHEEVTVERVPVQGEYTPGPDAFTEKDIDVPVRGEELVTDKRAQVTGEVRIQKQPVTEEQQITDTVRKERVTVEGEGDVRVDDTGNQPGMTS